MEIGLKARVDDGKGVQAHINDQWGTEAPDVRINDGIGA